MNERLFTLVNTILPCLTAAYAAAVFVTTRSISTARAWLLGIVIASLLAIGASIVVGSAVGLPATTESILESSASLYFIPTIVLVATATTLRSRRVNRNVGIGILVACFVAAAWASRIAASHFFDLVGTVY
jgi:hypothetical protein